MKSTIGQYNVLERLGGGALGDVYRVRDTRAGRTVALMVSPPELVASPERRSRFLDHARRAATLNHPNIAMLFDVVEQDDGCYLAYEFAAGPSLREEMNGRALEIRHAVHLAANIADALAEGHAKKIVHGDIRPETVVVTPKGSVKILSFGMTRWTSGGVARAKASTAPDSLTGEEAAVAPYLSPEQALGASTDHRSDLFALGAVLYEMVTGRAAFAAATPGATISNVVGQTPARPSTIVPGLPAELERIISKLLAKDLNARYQSAKTLAADLRRVASELEKSWEDPRQAATSKKSSGGLVAAIVLIALVVIGVVWWYLTQSAPPAP